MSIGQKELKPFRQQKAILRFRNVANICSTGSRGSAKSTTLMFDVIDRCRALGSEARILLVRESYAGLLEIMDSLYIMCVSAFGSGVTRSKADSTLRLPNGAIIQFSQLNDLESYVKHQGKNYDSLYFEEISNFSSTALGFVSKLRSNLRPPPGIRPHIHMTCNSFGTAHQWIYRNHISKAEFWSPYTDPAGTWWVNTFSTYKENPWIDTEVFRRQLVASSAGDESLLAAWEEGRWDTAFGSMFAPPWDKDVHVIKKPQYLGPVVWRIGADFGLSAPSVGLLGAKLRQQVGPYPAGSVLVMGETDTCIPGSLSEGDGSPPYVLAQMFKELMSSNGLRGIPVCIDDMRGLGNAETVVGLLRECQVNATKPINKNRTHGWTLIKSLLDAAVRKEGNPGLFIVEDCQGIITTLPEAPRSPKRPSDVDPRWQEDHHLDSLSYLLTSLNVPPIRSGRHIGTSY